MFRVTVMCPYCGHRNTVSFEDSKPVLVSCESFDEGGCKNFFVAKVLIEAVVGLPIQDNDGVL